jgi:hypothetical protein
LTEGREADKFASAPRQTEKDEGLGAAFLAYFLSLQTRSRAGCGAAGPGNIRRLIMHEMHIVNDLVADLLRLAKENNTTKITKVYLKMGPFTELNEDVVRFAIAEKGKGTPLEGAQVEFKKSSVRELRLLSFDCE